VLACCNVPIGQLNVTVPPDWVQAGSCPTPAKHKFFHEIFISCVAKIMDLLDLWVFIGLFSFRSILISIGA
jgi:hypothetical protein